jgi:hypothetical protein
MQFWSEVEWEIKFRPDSNQDVSSLYSTSEEFWGPLRLCEEANYFDTYFDTSGFLLGRSSRCIRRQTRRGKVAVVYKHPISQGVPEVMRDILIRREITCLGIDLTLDFGNPLQRRLPIFSELSDFLRSKTNRTHITLEPAITFDIHRSGYIPTTSLYNVEAPFYLIIDQYSFRGADGWIARVIELEVEICHLFPAAFERLIIFKEHLMKSIDCPPTLLSKYEYWLMGNANASV